MSIEYHTFAADGSLPDNFFHEGRFSQITIGKVGAQDMGGGVLLIQKDTLDGGKHTIRMVTEEEFQVMQDRTLRVEMPPDSSLYLELTGSVAPNLYVEHRQQNDDRK